MTNREKFLIVLMVGGVAYAAWSLTETIRERKERTASRTTTAPRTGTPGSPAAPVSTPATIAQSQIARLAPLHLSKEEHMILSTVSRSWAPSPFLDVIADLRQTEAERTHYAYTGHFRVGEQHFAIINGREYKVGDRIINTDFIVESIQADRVELQAPTGGRRITVGIKTTPATR